MPRRWTIRELTEFSTRRLLTGILADRRETITNSNAPLYQELRKLINWVEKAVPDIRVHDGAVGTVTLAEKDVQELVRDLHGVLADYRVVAKRTVDDDCHTNVLNMWISRFGGKRG